MNKNFEQMLRLVDYVDGLMVVDKNCIIRHYYTAYPELVNLRQDEPLNRSLFEIYPSLKREDSYTGDGRELHQLRADLYQLQGGLHGGQLQRRPH